MERERERDRQKIVDREIKSIRNVQQAQNSTRIHHFPSISTRSSQNDTILYDLNRASLVGEFARLKKGVLISILNEEILKDEQVQ